MLEFVQFVELGEALALWGGWGIILEMVCNFGRNMIDFTRWALPFDR